MGVREVEIKAGDQKKIFSRFSSSIPETIVFDVEAVNGEESLPDVDVRVTMEGSASMRLFWLVIIAAMVTIAIAGVIIALTQ